MTFRRRLVGARPFNETAVAFPAVIGHVRDLLAIANFLVIAQSVVTSPRSPVPLSSPCYPR